MYVSIHSDEDLVTALMTFQCCGKDNDPIDEICVIMDDSIMDESEPE